MFWKVGPTNLPVELLDMILTPIFGVRDSEFAGNVSSFSPFSNDAEPKSDILLVCKAWLPVAIRLLYRVVVLRSTAQAQALARTLLDDERKNLGWYVRQLRVEGAFGAAMDTIISHSPNIEDLCISLDIHSSDSVSGLCRRLPAMKIKHLILWDPRAGTASYENENPICHQLVRTITNCIETWETMQLALRHWYRHIMLRSYQDLRFFVANLKADIELGHHVESVVLNLDRSRDFAGSGLYFVFSKTSQLKRLVNLPGDDNWRNILTTRALAILSECCGKSLTKLTGFSTVARPLSEFPFNFSALQSLDLQLNFQVEFNLSTVPLQAMESLKHIYLSYYKNFPMLMKFFGHME
ncbi:hypothetical protein H0H87_010909 [Tephrocybe sp. NHM501043]|nr:hypothetical protein H0H87_010909 [Tephrocybe sp. NHM501043]